MSQVQEAQTQTAAIAEGETLIGQVISAMEARAQSLVAHGDALSGVHDQVGSEIGQVLVDLQFQDRSSQILDQVNASIESTRVLMQQARQSLQTGSTLPHVDVQALLSQMKAGYTTTEQHARHDAGGGRQPDDHLEGGSVSFF